MALSDYDFYVVGVRSDKRHQRREDEQRQCPFELEGVVFYSHRGSCLYDLETLDPNVRKWAPNV